MANDVDTLVGMGFSLAKVKKAMKATNNAGLQPAMDWILSHPEVSDEPEDDQPEPQALGTASQQQEEEGKAKLHF